MGYNLHAHMLHLCIFLFPVIISKQEKESKTYIMESIEVIIQNDFNN